MNVKKLTSFNSRDLFEVVENSARWWTACKVDNSWYLVSHNGRDVSEKSATGKRVVAAVEKFLASD